MNDKKIKELAIKVLWSEKESKSGDEYRSYVRQIDTMIQHFHDKNTPLNWMPIDILSDQEIADFIVTFIQRRQENRLLYNNLNYTLLKYNYSDLIVESKEAEFIQKFFKDEMGYDFEKEYKTLKIKEEIPWIKKAYRFVKKGHYRRLIKQSVQNFKEIIRAIFDEEGLFLIMGLEVRIAHYLDDLNAVLEVLAEESLLAVIIRNDFVLNKAEILVKLENEIDELYESVDKAVIKSRTELEHVRKEFRVHTYYMDTISKCYAQFLFRRARYGEQEAIFELLQKEIEAGICTAPESKYQMPLNIYTETELETFITEGVRVYDFQKKLQTTKELMALAGKYNDKKTVSYEASNLKLIFRELFMGNGVYRDKKAQTITKDALAYEETLDKCFIGEKTTEELVEEILANKALPSVYFMYLDARIARGYFREQGMLEEFVIFNRIMIKYKKR